MKNKKPFLALLAILLLGIAYFFYESSSQANIEKTNPFLAIPSRTNSFVSFNNIKTLNNKIDSLSYYEKLNKSYLFKSFKTQIQDLENLQNNIGANFFEIDQIVITLNNKGSEKLGFLTIASLKQNISSAQLKNALKTQDYSIKEYNYQSKKIFTFLINKTKQQSVSVYNNLLIYSNNAPLVEEAINSLLEENHKTKTKEFKALSFKNNSALNIFIDYSASNDLNNVLFNNDFLKNLNNNFNKASWSWTTINFQETAIDYKTNYSYLFQDGSAVNFIADSEPKGFTLDYFLPNNTAYFEAFNCKNNSCFSSNEMAYKYFKPWINEEYAYFCLETFDENYLKRAGLVIKAKNIDSAKLNLFLLNKEMDPIDSYENMAIYEMNINVLSKIFKSQIISFNKPYFSFIGKYVVFAEDINVLKVCHQKFKNNQFLKSDIVFQEYVKEKNGNHLKFLNAQKWHSTLKFIFNNQLINTDFGKLKQQYFIDSGQVYAKGQINFDIQKNKKTNILWEINLDTISNFKAQIVINADTKRKEIITQDKKNQVYLINQSGEILFKKKIAEKIIGDIYQIDINKANRLQYVFNTKNHIYVMDRKGKVLDGFPLKLPSESSNSLMVVNYDKAKKYRYFIACKNNKVYAYEANGKPLKAWSPLGDFGRIKNKIKHSVFDGKDYIYFNNAQGNFYAFNRKGEARFDFIPFNTSFKQAFEKTKTGFINLGEGSVYKVDLKGKTSAKVIGDENFTAFTNYPEKSAFAVSNGKEFRIAKSKWTLLGKTQLNSKIHAINKTQINGKKWFLVNTETSVYLINNIGEVHPDFPKKCNSEARILNFYSNKNKIMIVNETNKLKAFELAVSN